MRCCSTSTDQRKLLCGAAYTVGEPGLRSARVPIGRPIANAQIYILDSHLQPVPVGIRGELHIGGGGITRGYLHQAELTGQKFVSNPFNDQAGTLYKTGDLARYLPDGNIEYLGRVDQQVKIRGFRIELGEMEVRCVSAQASARRWYPSSTRRATTNA